MSRRRSANVEVFAKRNEPFEKLLKRFSKKCKKNDVVKEYLGKVSFYRTKSQKRRDKYLENKWLCSRKNKKNA